jgi:hypothetical protein
MAPTESDERRKRERLKAAISQKLEPRSGVGEQTGRPREECTSVEKARPWAGSRDEGSISCQRRRTMTAARWQRRARRDGHGWRYRGEPSSVLPPLAGCKKMISFLLSAWLRERGDGRFAEGARTCAWRFVVDIGDELPKGVGELLDLVMGELAHVLSEEVRQHVWSCRTDWPVGLVFAHPFHMFRFSVSFV